MKCLLESVARFDDHSGFTSRVGFEGLALFFGSQGGFSVRVTLANVLIAGETWLNLCKYTLAFFLVACLNNVCFKLALRTHNLFVIPSVISVIGAHFYVLKGACVRAHSCVLEVIISACENIIIVAMC